VAQNSVNETALGMLRSLRESNQAVTDSVPALQEHNIKFAQNVFTNGLEVLKSHSLTCSISDLMIAAERYKDR